MFLKSLLTDSNMRFYLTNFTFNIACDVQEILRLCKVLKDVFKFL